MLYAITLVIEIDTGVYRVQYFKVLMHVYKAIVTEPFF